ncbi:MAG: HAD family hydrolase [Steroidobacteraceae bacterium]
MTCLTGFKVLSFGCYGTLINRDSGVWTALRPLLTSGRVGLPRCEVLAAFDRHESGLEERNPKLPYSEILAEAHRALAREWGILCSDAEHTVFGRSVPKWPPFVGVPGALQYFKRYFKIVVLTNGDRDSFASSARRLEVRFDLICSAQEIGSYKPDPRNVRYMLGKLAKLGYAAVDILHIGTSPQRDLAPAAAAGLATAWINLRVADSEADKVSPREGTPSGLRFTSLPDLVRAHQEELRV